MHQLQAPRKDMADSPGGADADPRVVAAISKGESVSRLCWSDDFGVHPDRPGGNVEQGQHDTLFMDLL